MLQTTRTVALRLALAASALALSACSSMNMKMMNGSDHHLALTGAHEVPAVTTAASGTGTITVAPDRSVSGSVTATGMSPTMAHIHQGAPGVNGPVIIPLTQSGNVFTVPAGARLTDAQYDAFKAGNLYVNIHSAAHPGGEIRAQLQAH